MNPRRRILVFSLVQIAAMGTLFLALWFVVRGRVQPALTESLAGRAQLGLAQLASQLDVALATDDRGLIRRLSQAVTSDPDFSEIVLRDAEGRVLFRDGAPSGTDVFSGPPGTVRRTRDVFVAWAPVTLESFPLGSVALALSPRRIHALSAWMIGAGIVTLGPWWSRPSSPRASPGPSPANWTARTSNCASSTMSWSARFGICAAHRSSCFSRPGWPPSVRQPAARPTRC